MLVILIVLSFCVCTGRAAERTEVRMPTSLLVLINGRIIMKERKFVNIDVTDVMRRAQHASQELRVRSGLG